MDQKSTPDLPNKLRTLEISDKISSAKASLFNPHMGCIYAARAMKPREKGRGVTPLTLASVKNECRAHGR
jgi:hypothetical protein